MEVFFSFIQAHFPFIITHKYTFLLLGALIEGMNSMILGGFLVSTGSIKFVPTSLTFLIGYILNGYAWYTVGYFGGARFVFDRWRKIDENSKKVKALQRVEEYFERYSGKAIVLTKFTFSLTIATLIMAGSLKYNLRKFSWYNFLGSVGWVGLTLGIGYFFGESYKLLFRYLENVVLVILFLGGAVALVYTLKRIFQSAFVKSLFVSDRMAEFRQHMLKFKEEMTQFWEEDSHRQP